jgi:carotenoid 1,2-hydratase
MQEIPNPDTRYPQFNQPVPPGGYCWWYIDAISEDHQKMMTIIAFVGSVFSPYYKRARQRGNADPYNHCALNIALYGNQPGRWCMTERPAQVISTAAEHFVVGPSRLSYTGSASGQGTVRININEKAAPIPASVRGTIEITMKAQPKQYYLHPNKEHVWWPVSPDSAIQVTLEQPRQSWRGRAYVDLNRGTRPLEQDIDYWCWSRQHHQRTTTIHYDVLHRGTSLNSPPDDSLAISIDQHGIVSPQQAGQWQTLKKTGWRMPRHARSKTGSAAVIKTLEDTPFYSRSVIAANRHEPDITSIHESVSLNRFRQSVVQAMLHCRMPRYPWHKVGARRTGRV